MTNVLSPPTTSMITFCDQSSLLVSRMTTKAMDRFQMIFSGHWLTEGQQQMGEGRTDEIFITDLDHGLGNLQICARFWISIGISQKVVEGF